MNDPKLAFVIGGVQKGGTTTLDHIFRRHPQIQMANIKETHFFDNEHHDWNNPDYGILNAHFHSVDDRLRGEATPITLFWRPAIERIYRYNPDMKFVLLLRNPITRAFSHWQHEYAGGREGLPFAEAISDMGRHRMNASNNSNNLRCYSYIERGLYAQQLKFLRQWFPARNIHCEISEEFFLDQRASLGRIATFIGVDTFPIGICSVHRHPARQIDYPSRLEVEDAHRLAKLFCDEVHALENLLGRKLDFWDFTIGAKS